MSTEPSSDRCRQALQHHVDRMAECVGVAGPEAAVPTCPEWTVTDLVAHVGQTLHWVSEIVEGRITDPSQLPAEMVPLPADPQAWPGWLSDAAARATAAFSDTALKAPVFNAAGDGRTGGEFWLHSMVNEAVVHGYDAAAAAGASYNVDPDIGAMLVTNHLAMLTSPTWAAQRSDSANALRGTGETLHWHATDNLNLGDSGEWLVQRNPDGATWQHGHDAADVTVQGPAGSLLLVLTRRLPLTDAQPNHVTVDGDLDLAHHWIQHSAHQAG